MRLAVISAAALFMLAAPVRADVIQLKAEGTARGPSANPAAVKERAIDGAISSAVREAVRLLARTEGIAPEPDKLEASVYSRSRNFVSNFRITAEDFRLDPPPAPASPEGAAADGGTGPEAGAAQAPPAEETGAYTVWIEASVDAAGLKAALAAALSAEARPVSIVIADAADWEAYKAVVASLERVVALKEVEPVSFFGHRVRLRATSTAEPAVLAARVGRELGMAYVAFVGDGGEIVIKTVPDAVGGVFK